MNSLKSSLPKQKAQNLQLICIQIQFYFSECQIRCNRNHLSKIDWGHSSLMPVSSCSNQSCFWRMEPHLSSPSTQTAASLVAKSVRFIDSNGLRSVQSWSFGDKYCPPTTGIPQINQWCDVSIKYEGHTAVSRLIHIICKYVLPGQKFFLDGIRSLAI